MSNLVTLDKKPVTVGYLYSEVYSATCPHCGMRYERDKKWEIDFATRLHDYIYHGIPFDED